MSSNLQFRATSDHMLQMLDRLRAVEKDKQAAPFGSPEFVAHAQEAERLSRMAFRWSGMQLNMAESAAGEVQHGEASSEPLVNLRTRPLDHILASWREAQLRLEIAKPGSPEAAAAAAQVESLREEFHAVQEDKLLHEDSRPG